MTTSDEALFIITSTLWFETTKYLQNKATIGDLTDAVVGQLDKNGYEIRKKAVMETTEYRVTVSKKERIQSFNVASLCSEAANLIRQNEQLGWRVARFDSSYTKGKCLFTILFEHEITQTIAKPTSNLIEDVSPTDEQPVLDQS